MKGRGRTSRSQKEVRPHTAYFLKTAFDFRAGRHYALSISSAKACAITIHIHRLRPWAAVPLPGVCFLTDAYGCRIADSALRALLLACRLELRHARLRVSRANV